MPFRLPNNTQRTAVLGRTGSGKTHFSAWLLSHMNYDKQPWIVLDIKGDNTILNQIEDMEEIDYTKRLPKLPGLYVAKPLPDETDNITGLLHKIWTQQKTGLYIDEGHLVPDSGVLKNLFVTGRSRKIPIISVSQRPVSVPRHLFSEADFYAIFHLNDKRDKKTVNEFCPVDLDVDLPEFHSRWYQVSENSHFILRPIPDKATILQRFRDRLRKTARWNGFI